MNRRGIIVLLTGVIALALVNYSIYSKESLLENGEVIYLELAPVDPRSLLQGDYMALRFSIGNEIRSHLQRETKGESGVSSAENGFVIVKLSDDSIAHFVRLDDGEKLAGNERKVLFRYRQGHVKFATNGFFFQEGTGQHYEKAHFGKFRIDSDGHLLLTALMSKSLQRLGPSETTL